MIYRLGNFAKYKVSFLPAKLLITLLYVILDRLIVRGIFGCLIPSRTIIGWGLHIVHPNGIIINGNSKIGSNLKIHHQVTIGQSGNDYPVIGDDCYIGAGAKIIGKARLGNNIKVGANAVVTKSFKSNSILVGVPAKYMKA